MAKPVSNQFRIIAGEFRHRTLAFPDAPGLRPTPDRVRETVFNWLQLTISGARCLDLFAGSGALGFEAASRGASSVICIEHSRDPASAIGKNIKLLNAPDMSCVQENAMTWLKQTSGPAFDVIFLDPPYSLRILPELLALIDEKRLLTSGGYLYMEDSEKLEILTLPEQWELIRSKRAGQVYYGLCRNQAGLL